MRARRPVVSPPAILLGVLTVSVLVSGCAGAPGGTPDPGAPETPGAAKTVAPAEIVAGYDCLAPNLSSLIPPSASSDPSDPARPDAPPAGRVPAGFVPITAVRCDEGGQVEDAAGQWSAVTAVALSGDLEPLLAALAEPDDRSGAGPCTADAEIIPALWLVDGAGRALHAHHPRDRCGKTKAGVRAALAGLSVRETTIEKQTLLVPRAALDSGCAVTAIVPEGEDSLWTPPPEELLPGTIGATPAPPSRITDAEVNDVDGMRWCRYAVEPDPLPSEQPADTGVLEVTIMRHPGRFVSGGTFDTATAALVAGVTRFASDSSSCDETTTTFLVLWPSSDGHDAVMPLTAELDGCGLLYRSGDDVRLLPTEVRELLTTRTGE